MMDLHRPWRVCKGKPVITDVLTLQYYRNWPFSGFRDSCGSLDRRSAFVRIRMYFCIRFCYNYKPSWKTNNKNGLLKARLPKRDLKVNILTGSLCEDTVAISLRTYCGPTKWLIHNSMRLRLCGGYNQKNIIMAWFITAWQSCDRSMVFFCLQTCPFGSYHVWYTFYFSGCSSTSPKP